VKTIQLTKAIGTLALFAGLISGCSSGANSVTDLSPMQFADKIKSSNIQILDVRTPAEFAEGHISNAMNIDFESGNFKDQISNLDKNKTYALYCRSGRRSGLASQEMANMGFKSLLNMSGGTIDWTAAGLDLVK
jgi:phage shock protein E